MREVPNGATVCSGCQAEKGYTQAQGTVYGRGRTIAFGVVLPGAIAILFLWWWIGIRVPGVHWPLYVAAFFFIPVVLSVWRLAKGPVWYR